VKPREGGVGGVEKLTAAASKLEHLTSRESVHHQLQFHVGESLHGKI
jgi:hypothetical protein